MTRKASLIITSSLVLCISVHAQVIQIPNKIRFADMELLIKPGAKKHIQKKIHTLINSSRDYKIIVERIKLYMPIIERIIREEGLPEDFKYLVIQESRLIADLVSSAHAVGFWQFKSAAAAEVGLRMDRYIDERMNIVAATRGGTKYLKSHNTHFENWLYALLAYYTGKKGAESFTDKRYFGARTMKIDQDTHWYIHHFLAHKLVFQNVVGQEQHPQLCLYECNDAQGKTLQEISKQYGITQARLKQYNKWLKPKRVPKDATCPVIIPMTHRQYAQFNALLIQDTLAKYKINYKAYQDSAQHFPTITTYSKPFPERSLVISKFNDIAGLKAQAGDNLTSLAQSGNLPLAKFLAYNDIDAKHRVEPGQVYYFQPKKNKAKIHYHIVQPGETWWEISQKYGIRKQGLLHKNRIRQEIALEPGRVLWLRFIRPSNIPIAYEQLS